MSILKFFSHIILKKYTHAHFFLKHYICITKCYFQNLTAQPKCVNIFSTPMLLSLFKVQKSRKPKIYLVIPSTLYTLSLLIIGAV